MTKLAAICRVLCADNLVLLYGFLFTAVFRLIFCRCGVAKCRGKIGGNLPQVMETCSKTLAKHANKKKKSAQDNEEEADQLLYTTVYVSFIGSSRR